MTAETAQALLNAVAMSRVHFDKVIAERRERLAIRDAWHRLAVEYQRVRKRYERRFHRRMKWHGRIRDGDIREWSMENLDLDPGAVPISNVRNVLICLRDHPAFSGVLAYDPIAAKNILRAPLPMAHWDFNSFDERALTLGDVTEIHEFLQMLGLDRIDRKDVEAAIKLVARENPIRGRA